MYTNLKFNGLLIDELMALVEKVEEYTGHPFEQKEARKRTSNRDNVTAMNDYATRPRHFQEAHEVA